jgi:Na+/melibiose symporter-like transporter
MILAFDIFRAISGYDMAASFALVLFVVYFLWFFTWGKKQVGARWGIILAVIIMYLTFFLYPELIWIPVILFIFATFGKELLERIPRDL